MTKAIEQGLPKQKIEEAAARISARIDRGEQVIVGVNKYKLKEEAPIDILDVDNKAVRLSQIKRLETIRAARDSKAVEAALDALTNAAKDGSGNLLALAVEAMKLRATVGEISAALEKIYGRFNAEVKVISGVYGAEYAKDNGLKDILKETALFADAQGRRPTILVAKMGQDGHDRGVKVIASAFADMGFDVEVGPLFATPEEVVDLAVNKNVHMIGISSHAAGHKTLVPELINILHKKGRADIIVVCGGVIPQQDYAFLEEAGVAAIFGPGTNIPEAASKVLKIIQRRNDLG